MVSLKRTADARYQGWDGPAGRSVGVESGATVEVSEAKAAQLLADFPDEWESTLTPTPASAGLSTGLPGGEGLPSKGRGEPDGEVVADITRRLKAGETAESLATEFGVDQATIYRWTKTRRTGPARDRAARPSRTKGGTP